MMIQVWFLILHNFFLLGIIVANNDGCGNIAPIKLIALPL